MKKLLLTGLAATVLATSVAACDPEETRAGGEYNKVVTMPVDCDKPLSAGYSGTYSSGGNGGYQSNYDTLSCISEDGNTVTIYRMNKQDNVWYQTKIMRERR